MEFRQFPPVDILKPYIAYFFLFKSEEDIEFGDTVSPSGNMEVIFNLGEGVWESAVENQFQKTPPVELWGQITRPLAIKSKGRHTMLGIRFLTHSASCFFKGEIGTFNDRVSNLSDILGSPVRTLHAKLLETDDTPTRITLIEHFLLRRLDEGREGVA